jgi:hypothetical protein
MLIAEGQTMVANIDERMKVVETLQGSSFLAIKAALKVLEPRKPELEKSEIVVVRQGDAVLVILAGKKEDKAAAKDFGVQLEPNKELNAQDLAALLSKMDQLDVLDRIQGSHYPLLRTAVDVFTAKKLELADYKLTLVRKKDSFSVIFADKKREPGTRGSGDKPGFEVEMNARDLKVFRSNFVR